MQNFDKSFEKKRLRNFWTEFWPYIPTEVWLNRVTSLNPTIHKTYINKLKDGLRKLTLEKKITESELFNLLDMLNSSDGENKIVVLCVMQKYKKTKFKK